jgi:hypothetical protein
MDLRKCQEALFVIPAPAFAGVNSGGNPVISKKGKIVERALLWFRCAAMHDPVRPVMKRPAALGWEAKQRQVDLVIERPLRGEDLLSRMKGWFTADVMQVTDIVKKHGRLTLLDDYDLVVETKDAEAMETLSLELAAAFGAEAWIEQMPKAKLK